MSELEKITIPNGAEFPGTEISSLEDTPPTTESSSDGDNLNAQRAADAKSNRELREKFAEKAYKVAKYGLYWWATVLLLSATGRAMGKEIFSDEVLIAVTAASTLNLFAAFLGVIRWLFPHAKSNTE
ncbi:hypothetical protein C3U89_001956 [Escherichia coli]|nr:hypothetical protein [Escherichia coli]